MPRYLLEIRHSNEHEGCVRALEAIANFGPHLVTNAEFGCQDGVHTGWLIVDVDSHDDARRIVPPQYRNDSKVVQLKKWSKEEIQEMVEGLGS
jgi:hypothetical protein